MPRKRRLRLPPQPPLLPSPPARAPAPRGRRQPPCGPRAYAALPAPRPWEKSKKTALNRRREWDPTDAETHALYGPPASSRLHARTCVITQGRRSLTLPVPAARRAPWERVGDVAARLGIPGAREGPGGVHGVGWLLRVLSCARAGRPGRVRGRVPCGVPSPHPAAPRGKGTTVVFPAVNNYRPLPCVKQKRTSGLRWRDQTRRQAASGLRGGGETVLPGPSPAASSRPAARSQTLLVTWVV